MSYAGLWRLPIMLIAGALISLVASACTPVDDTSTTTTMVTTTITTTTIPSTTTTPPDGLSDAARSTVKEILDAADSGDIDRLAELALRGEASFTASFGEDFASPEELAAYWRDIGGDEIAATIAALLRMPTYTTTTHDAEGNPVEIYVSPRALSEDATEVDRRALEDALGSERVADWWADGMYLGYRVGIDETGDWRFFVIGD